MSKYSSLTSQHTALRDLERQRLERMIGQLKREVNSGSSTPSCATPHRPGERRFQPTRRRDRASGALASNGGPPSREAAGRGPVAFRAVPEAPAAPDAADATDSAELMPPSAPATGDLVRGGPTPPLQSREGAPSLEIAWLWRKANQMEEGANEVTAFLARHDLSRYTALLVNDAGAPGTSLEALRNTDDTVLEEVGLPPSPRRRLRAALHAELEATSAAGSIAASSSSSPRLEPDNKQWGRLGYVPQGWHRTQQQPVRPSFGCRLKTEPTVLVDAAIGGEDCIDIDGDDIPENGAAWLDSASSRVTAEAVGVGPSESGPPTTSQQHALLAARSATHTQAIQAAAPAGMSGARSRPGSSAGNERVCCYECFKQISAELAFTSNDAMLGITRRFCSDACAASFQVAVAARESRARELRELRDSLIGDTALDC